MVVGASPAGNSKASVAVTLSKKVMNDAHLASGSATNDASVTDGFQGVNSISSLPARDSRDIPVVFQRSHAVAPLS